MKKIERLAEMASRRTDPVPLDAGGVMARIRGLRIEDEAPAIVPLGFFAGGAAVAALVAAGVSVIAATAWSEMLNPPLVSFDSLINLMDIIP